MQEHLKTEYPKREFRPIKAQQRLFDPTILPIRCQDGPQLNDVGYSDDPMYQDFLLNPDSKEKLKDFSDRTDYEAYVAYLKDRNKDRPFSATDPILMDRKYILGTAGWMVNNLIGTLLYYQEAGQLRTPYEEGQAVSLFAYDVGLFDFAPDDSLKKFVQKRAFIKVIMKFSDIWDMKTQEFVLNTQAEKDRFKKIAIALNSYDPKIDETNIGQLFKYLYPYLK